MPSCYECMYLDSFPRPTAGFIAKCTLLDIWFEREQDLLGGDLCPYFERNHICAYCAFFDAEKSECRFWHTPVADTDSCDRWLDSNPPKQKPRIYDWPEGWAGDPIP